MASSRKKGGMKPTKLNSDNLLLYTSTFLLVSVSLLFGAESTYQASAPTSTAFARAFALPRIQPGPKVTATRGEVWPKPAFIIVQKQFFSVNPRKFIFKSDALSCGTIQKAYGRYRRIMKTELYLQNYRYVRNLTEDLLYSGDISTLNVRLTTACERKPSLEMDESYNLTVDGRENVLTAATTWGILRGLETFVQLLYPALDGVTLFVNATTIQDAPRFPHRGLLIDTSRHFIPVPYILLELDAMAAVKMNVLHWHIVDDQSFPYQSHRYPQLSNKGAYNNVSAVYTPKDIGRIIEYARQRGIRVVPEFDTPGHTRSWGEGQPGLLTECYSSGRPTGEYSNIDPTKEENKEFIETFFVEVGTLFYDKHFHIGGDEVPPECWNSNPDVLSYMKKHKISGDYNKLQGLYIKWLTEMLRSRGKESIAWEEVFSDSASDLPRNVIIHVWKSNPEVILPIVVTAGYRALLSKGWYLDHLGETWQSMYLVEPITGNITERAILGGEACMWGEMVDATNLHSRIWPRAAAVAERLWSPKYVSTLRLAAKRIEELNCRLRRRGVPASPPNGPGFCEN